MEKDKKLITQPSKNWLPAKFFSDHPAYKKLKSTLLERVRMKRVGYVLGRFGENSKTPQNTFTLTLYSFPADFKKMYKNKMYYITLKNHFHSLIS